MASAQATSEERDEFPDPSATTDVAHHPTLAEIEQRQREIEIWDALSVGGYRFAKAGTIISFLVTTVAVFLIVSPVPPNWPWNVPLSIGATFAAVAMVVCGLLWLDKPDIGLRPELLKVVPFSRAEDQDLINGQDIEPYSACCTCPGCGEESTHLVRRPAKGDPAWASVTRQCRVCKRAWAQS
jgi:hypothetical protein